MLRKEEEEGGRISTPLMSWKANGKQKTKLTDAAVEKNLLRGRRSLEKNLPTSLCRKKYYTGRKESVQWWRRWPYTTTGGGGEAAATTAAKVEQKFVTAFQNFLTKKVSSNFVVAEGWTAAAAEDLLPPLHCEKSFFLKQNHISQLQSSKFGSIKKDEDKYWRDFSTGHEFVGGLDFVQPLLTFFGLWAVSKNARWHYMYMYQNKGIRSSQPLLFLPNPPIQVRYSK